MFAAAFLSRVRRLGTRLAPVLLLTAALPACALLTGDDEEDEDDDDITGMWENEEGYLRITSSTITFYGDSGEGCYFIVSFDIDHVGGDVYEVDVFGEMVEIEIRRDGDQLELESEGEVDVYDESDVDPEDLEECEIPVFEPELGTCSSHTQLSVPGSVNGSLTTGDLSSDGFLYDRYRIQIATTSNVEITQSSTQIDSYLYLFEADGTYIDEDDDAAGNFNASIEVFDLPPGCYVVIATSYDVGEQGSYTLTATSF